MLLTLLFPLPFFLPNVLPFSTPDRIFARLRVYFTKAAHIKRKHSMEIGNTMEICQYGQRGPKHSHSQAIRQELKSTNRCRNEHSIDICNRICLANRSICNRCVLLYSFCFTLTFARLLSLCFPKSIRK